MPSLIERCACGAKIELLDVHWTQVVAFTAKWRASHKCVAQSVEHEVNLISVDASRNELPMGFSRGMRTETGDPEPLDPDEYDRNRKTNK